MEYAHQASAVADGAVVDHREKILGWDPGDLFGFRGVGWCSDVVRANADVQLMWSVRDADGRLKGERVAQRTGTPAGLLFHLACGCGGGRLIRLDDPDRNLPSPAVVNEPVPTQHQQPRARLVQ